ncbi:pyridoxal phosphate-dependent decarboxylase family protein [Armatimonas sp.]|uniref:pyridoxal phosphate-dependent decarboxylase family protein n=1 Tax=Armatimonas sp. TaxID=1872638 RepID=UPI003750DE4A
MDDTLDILKKALATLDEGFADLPAHAASVDIVALDAVLQEVAVRLQDNYPYFHPLYAGQMLKPPHPVARLAYMLALHVNPNNHALDGGRASSAMEKEAVAALAAMFGWTAFLGHLTSGGTMANLEALWVAGRLAPGKTVLASSQAHYTHARISAVLGLPFEAVPVDRFGHMDVAALEKRLERGDVGTVVATLGTTATGSVDPLPEILVLREKCEFRLHADAAYGGYFGLAENLGNNARTAFDCISAVDSLVIDPHKHGLQPYGCGCVLFADPSVGRFYKHDSPYTYFSSTELHLGEISLECSRAGAAAVALWATQRLLPLTRGGEFSGMLTQCRSAARSLYAKLAADPRFLVGLAPELDIVVWTVRPELRASARAIFEEAARRGLHLALAELPGAFFGLATPTVTCLRSVQMKPEHADPAWQEMLWALLSEATAAVMQHPPG